MVQLIYGLFIIILIIYLIIYGCYKSNKISPPIGGILFILLCILILYYIFQLLFFPMRTWLTGTVCVGVFVIYLLTIKKPFSVKLRRIAIFSLAGILVILCVAVFGFRAYQDSVPNALEEVNLVQYEPFRYNTLVKNLNETSTLSLVGTLPRLDGATALYPLYSAFVRATYPAPNGDENKYCHNNIKSSVVICSKTSGAFNNLLNGYVDLIFLMGLSNDQQSQARELNLELELTPIGKESFVFFVNSYNPISNLTVMDVKGIYSGRITKWSELGGVNAAIKAYQRLENSGSQTMLEEIMEGTPIMKAPDIDVYPTMRGMYKAVAAYKNYRNSLGYSFRFYLNEMIAENKVKLLNINGVEPTVVNIANGSYPFTNYIYAISIDRDSQTTEDAERRDNIKKLIEWILSPQGQNLIEKTGYVPL